jgi:spore coat polysaccharide biosynthesis predicted glycosyltransferase SpsG
MALAEAFRLSGVESSFAGLFDVAAMEQLAVAGFHHVDLGVPVNCGTDEGDLLYRATSKDQRGFIVVDSYRADAAYLAGMRVMGRATVMIDDFKALETYPCDVVLNFTWEAPSLDYPAGPLLLLGPDYFPARRRLAERRPLSLSRDRCGPARHLLIAIGGSDPKRIADRLVRILIDQKVEVCLRVIAGSDDDLAGELAHFRPTSRIVPRQPDLSEQLLWADACITGGGLIKYESAFMSVPAAAISQNEGQAGETGVLARAGLVFDLGLADERSDMELGAALNHFLSDNALRDGLNKRVRDVFSPDPAVRAASAILQAVGH